MACAVAWALRLANAVGLQLENAQAEITRLKKLFAPKKKFNIDTSTPAPRGLPAFPGQAPAPQPGVMRPTLSGSTQAQAIKPAALRVDGNGNPRSPSATKETDESMSRGESEQQQEQTEEQRRLQLAALAAEKDDAARAADPVGWETKKRLQKRLSIDTRLAGI